MGLPVIATDVRGCRQVVEHERTGLLIPVRDADAIARAVRRLAADPDLRRRWARPVSSWRGASSTSNA